MPFPFTGFIKRLFFNPIPPSPREAEGHTHETEKQMAFNELIGSNAISRKFIRIAGQIVKEMWKEPGKKRERKRELCRSCNKKDTV